MRNLFKMAALPAAILALSLGAFACGDDDDDKDGGAGTTGRAGTGGGEAGTTGEAGTGGQNPNRTLPEQACDTWYRDAATGTGPCSGLVRGGVPINHAQCVESFNSMPEENLRCIRDVTECDNDQLQACLPKGPPPPEPTEECDNLCDHVYSDVCNLYFPADEKGTPATAGQCKLGCPGMTGWTAEIKECLTTFECTSDMSTEEKRANLNACLPSQG